MYFVIDQNYNFGFGFRALKRFRKLFYSTYFIVHFFYKLLAKLAHETCGFCLLCAFLMELTVLITTFLFLSPAWQF